MNKKHVTLLLFSLLLSTISFSQEKIIHKTSLELFETGFELKAEKKYEKAYEQFMLVNKNDTSYFESRLQAINVMLIESKFDTIKTVAQEALNVRFYNPYRNKFLNLLGYSNIQQEKYQEALDILTAAKKEFPRDSRILHNRAVALYELDQRDEAIEELQSAIRYNPNAPYNHLQLGKYCQQAGLLTKAALAINMALYLGQSYDLYLALHDVYNNNYDGKIKPLKFREDEDYEYFDDIIKNKVALNKKFKTPAKLDISFVKQNFLLFSEIEFDKGSKGFWNQNYIQFYKEILNANEFPNFTYLQCYSISSPKIKKVHSKKKNQILTFYKWSQNKHLELMNAREVWNGTQYAIDNFNHSGSYGFNYQAEQKDGKITGNYVGNNSDGLITAVGEFSNEGKQTGTWTFYDDMGRIQAKQDFKNDEANGQRITYYTNGSLNQKFNYESGNNISGIIENYYPYNILYSSFNYNDETIENGPFKIYHSNGNLKEEGNYDNGKRKGVFKSYYYSGEKNVVSNYENDQLNGEYISYYSNGKINAKGSYLENEQIGSWEFYHENGEIYQKGEYQKDYPKGLWVSYRADGTKEKESDFGETSKKNGVIKEYDLDGKLASEFHYKNEDLVSYKTFNLDGSVSTEAKTEKKQIEFVSKYPNGNVRIKGTYKKDLRIGTWEWRNRYGIIISQESYTNDGLLVGEQKEFFDNGEIKEISNYKNGQQDGYYVSYFENNGKIKTQGNYAKGYAVGVWEYYNVNGGLSTRSYYLNNEKVGEVEHYDKKGKLSSTSQYYLGNYEGSYLFDTSENVIKHLKLTDGQGTLEFIDAFGQPTSNKIFIGCEENGKVSWKYENGKTSVEGEYLNGYRHGTWKWYYENGKIQTQGNFENGDKEGEWLWYFENGKLDTKKHFVHGQLTGERTSYYENGKIQTKRSYRNDERHGSAFWYDELGKIQLIVYYKDGDRLGYSYLGKDNKPVKMIPFTGEKGDMIAYFPNGKKSFEATYLNGNLNGKKTYYNSNGTISDKSYYKNGYVDSTYYGYYSSGKIKEETEYKNGYVHGKSKKYYANGKLKSEENFIEGDLYGISTYYSTSGVKSKVEYYDNRKKHH